MANKIKLGSAPKTFKPVTVTVDMPDGTKGEIPLTFKYRTQDEFYKYQDDFLTSLRKKDDAAKAEAEKEAGEKQEFKFQEAFGQARKESAKHVLGAIDSWELDVALNEENIINLLNEVPASGIAIGEAYQSACTQGRLGN